MRLISTGLLIAWALVATNAGAAITLLDKDNWKFLFGGFAQFDAISDSTRSLNEVSGNSPIAKAGTPNGDNGRTIFSPRNSRLAFTALPPPVGKWRTKGYIETDFLGNQVAGVSESAFYTNPAFRVRHAYLQAEDGDWTILAGQYWTLFGWQPYYFMNTLTEPPIPSVLYQRTPQVTAIRNFKFGETLVQAGLSILRPAARDSQIPSVDAGLRVVLPGRKAPYQPYNGDVKLEPMSFGVSGTARTIAVGATPAVRHTGTGGAVNALVPILTAASDKDVGGALTLQGEFTVGSGFGDEYPGWNGNINPAPAGISTGSAFDPGLAGLDGTAVRLVAFRNFNLSLQYQLPTDWCSWITLGYAQLNATNVNTMAAVAGSMVYNRSEAVFADLLHDFTNQIRAGLGYTYFQTRYVDGSFAHHNRLQVSAWFRF